MNPDTQSGMSAADRLSDLINECADVIFNIVPVMMYTVDEEGLILKENPRWLSAMGYDIQEVVGQRFIGFLTEECRIQSLSDTLPLFWESGRVHSSSCRLLRKDARVLYVALDSVVTQEPLGELGAIGVFRKADDLVQWQWAKNSIKALQSLGSAQHGMERLFLTNEGHPSTRQAVTHIFDHPGGRSDPPRSVWNLPSELSSTLRDVADTLAVLADLATNNTAGPQSHPHELVTLADAFRTAVASLLTSHE
jgi:PAS domain S-box-containing protein